MHKNLEGFNVVYFESRHAKTLGELIRLQGGNPISAPSLKEVPLENNPQVFEFGEKFLAGKIDVLILLTGVGTKALMQILETRFEREKILEAFRKTTVVPRGPKPIRVLKDWNVPYALTVPEPNTWKELLAEIDKAVGAQLIVPLQDKLVAVQEYGVSNPELLEALEKRNAKVIRVPVYAWTLPDDIEPLKKAIEQIIENKIQIAMFTTAVQVEHLFKVGAIHELPLRNALNKMVVASIGPDCTQALKIYGLKTNIEPEHSKMAELVLETAKKARGVILAKARI